MEKKLVKEDCPYHEVDCVVENKLERKLAK